MANLYISEFAGPASMGTMKAPFGGQPSLADQVVAIGGASTQSAAFGARTNMVLIANDATAGCSVAFGVNPTATTTNMRIPANATLYFAVVPGQKVAVITNT